MEGMELVATSPVSADIVHVDVDVASAIKRKLGAKTPKEYRKSRPGPYDARTGQRKQLLYVPWGYVARVLNQVFGPAWSYTYDPPQFIDLPPLPAKPPKGKEPGRPEVPRQEAMVTVTLTTPFGKQMATAGHTYYPNNAETLKSDAVASAVSKALRRAGARLGIGLDIALNDDAEFLDNADNQNVDLNVFREAASKLGLPLRSAIAMISEQITGDQDTLTSLPDLIEAVGSLESVLDMLSGPPEPPPIEGEIVKPKREKKS